MSMRVVGYVRISRLTEESTSVARQRQEIESTVASRGWRLIAIEEDVDVSASKKRLDRPGLNAVRRRIAAKEADAVLVWRLDRIARSVVDFGTLLDEDLQIVSATEPFDTTSSMGRAMAEILQVFAAMESRTIGARVTSGRAYLPSVGRFPGGPIPFGYQTASNPEGAGRVLVIDPYEAGVIRELATLAMEGASMPTLIGHLRDRAVATPRSEYRKARQEGLDPTGRDQGKWQITSLQGMLTGDSLLGRMKYRGNLVQDAEGLPDSVWEPILDLETLQRLRARIADPRKPSARPQRPKVSRLLSGFVFCGLCGSKMHVNADRRGDASYRCSGPVNGVECRAPRITASGLEKYVADRFLGVAGGAPEFEIIEEIADSGTSAEIAELEALIREAATDFARPGADRVALSRRVDSLEARANELRSLPANVTERRTPTGRTLAQAWEADGLDLRRKLLGEAIDHVEIAERSVRGPRFDESRVSIRWVS